LNILILFFSCYVYGGYNGYGGYNSGGYGYNSPVGLQHGKAVAVQTRHHFPGGYGEGAYHGSDRNVHIALPDGGKAYSYSGGYSMGYGARYGHGAPSHLGGGVGHAVGHNKGFSTSYGYGNPAVMKHALAGLQQDIQGLVHSTLGNIHQGGLFGGAPGLPF
ncbi:abscisic acid and environmental stress-inducible protein-like, partial [Limulus polyphemus]|uniref:Abscisic acid and environmental stress-inducible protein-like n=1 Tax=Limulus polyphemus TaxID=6850 RepID=A0ABM1C478_LIMPO